MAEQTQSRAGERKAALMTGLAAMAASATRTSTAHAHRNGDDAWGWDVAEQIERLILG